MNTAPFESWDGVEAYFTYADSPAMMMLLLLGSVVVTFGVIILAAVHEKKAYSSH